MSKPDRRDRFVGDRGTSAIGKMAVRVSLRSIARSLSYGLLWLLCVVDGQVEELPKSENNGCSQVKIAYASKGFNRHEVPSKMVSGK